MAPTEFTIFRKLPLEMRDHIWSFHRQSQAKVSLRRGLSRQSRYARIQWGGDAALCVDKETRGLSLRYYPKIPFRLGWHVRDYAEIRLNLDVDLVIFFTMDILRSFHRMMSLTHEMPKIKHIAIRRVECEGRHLYQVAELVNFIHLQTIDVHLRNPTMKWWAHHCLDLQQKLALLSTLPTYPHPTFLPSFVYPQPHGPFLQAPTFNMYAEIKGRKNTVVLDSELQELAEAPITHDEFLIGGGRTGYTRK